MSVCPKCGHRTVKPLSRERSGPATQFVMSYLDRLRPGHPVKAGSVSRKDLTARQINNAFCYLEIRGLVRRVSYGVYAKVDSPME